MDSVQHFARGWRGRFWEIVYLYFAAVDHHVLIRRLDRVCRLHDLQNSVIHFRFLHFESSRTGNIGAAD